MDILFNQIKKEMYDVTNLKIKGNEYKVLVILGEDHLGGEDFNQRIINHIFSSIKVNDKLLIFVIKMMKKLLIV